MSVTTKRKSIHCLYRLLNILFSDLFACEFSSIGNSCNKYSLTSGNARNEQFFWEKVQVAFVDSTPTNIYDDLYFKSDPEFNNLSKIDPSHIVNHEWSSIWKIWRDINTRYKSIQSNYSVSGNHEPNI